jgi:hypothetical protein
MCGPSSEMKLLEAQQASLASLMRADYAQRFAEQSDVLQKLNRIFVPLAQAGPSQRGMSEEERAALNTAAMVNVSGATRSAQQATRTALAGQGGGAASPLTSGIQQQIAGALASRGAQQLAALQTDITRQDYALGRDQWRAAIAGLQALGSQYNPVPYGELGASTTESAFKQATKIQEMRNQAEAAIAGGIGSLAMDALTFGAGGLINPNGPGFGGFLRGGLEALTGVKSNPASGTNSAPGG